MTKRTLFSTTTLAGVLALTALSPAWAQDAAAPQDQATEAPALQTPTAQNEDEGEDVEAVVVTGSRIRLRDYTAPSPVTTISGEQMENAGATNVTDFLQEIPALINSVDAQDNANAGAQASAGINLLNLRNLGTQRTLVLVDGRRHVPGQAGSADVDTNSIPVALIERVEVLTGGASATYGADAVSGVVNFITRRDFEGLDLRYQTGWSDEGGANSNFGSVLFGRNFMGGRGNATIGYEFSLTDPLNRDQRARTRLGERLSLVNNPAERATPGDDPAIPDRVFLNNIRYIDSALEGAVYTTAFEGPTRSGVSFLGTGAPFVDGVFLGGFSMRGGSGTLTDVFQTQLIPGLDRQSINGSFNFELEPGHRFFADAKYSRSETQFVSQPTFDYALYVPIDNPFIPASIRADATRPGNLGTREGIQFWNEAIFGLDPDFVGPGVFLGRDNLDLGELVRDIKRETFRTVLGLEGDLNEGLRYELSYVYGRTKETNVTSNDRINERFFAAIDAVRDPATGQIVCRSTLNPSAVPLGNMPLFGSTTQNPATFGTTFTPGRNSGCVPANIFGQNISPEAKAWINNTSRDEALIQQHVGTGFISGDTQRFFSLQGGPVSYVLGAEYRKEMSRTEPDRLAALGALLDEDITWLGQGTAVKGEFDVKEGFAELSAPLLRDVRFAEALTLSAAYRYSYYSTSGGAQAWTVGGQYRPIDSLMFRASTARAVRAPNISELFTPQVQTFALLADPCDRDNVALGRDPATRLANCTAALAPLGLSPLTFDDTSSSSVQGVVGGNPDLEPEEADTLTLGVVFTPTFIPGLSMAVDYYDVEISNAINTFTAQSTIENCFDIAQPNAFCNGLTRQASPNPNFNGRITGFQQFSLNVASYVTSGYDFSFRYDLRPERFGIQRDIGRFAFSLVGNKLEELTFIEVPGAEPDEDLGEVGSPEWQATFDATWFYKNLMVNYGYAWFDETIRFADTYEADPDYLEEQYKFYSARSVHDLQVRLNLADNRYAVYAGVNNFTNQEPDLGALQTPVSIRGRFFYLGATVKLDRLPGM